jgi:hypothetical protein
VCKKSGEYVEHLLLYCEIASSLLSAIFSHVGLAWVMPKSCRPFCLLERFGKQSLEHICVEDGFVLPFVVSLEGNKL